MLSTPNRSLIERRSFLSSLELKEHPVFPSAPKFAARSAGLEVAKLALEAVADSAAPISTPTEGKPEAYVDNGSLVSFVNNVPSQQRTDVLNSSLLAQLAANKKHDPYNDTETWFKFYAKVMKNVGWVIQDFEFTAYKISEIDFKLSQLTLQILSGLVGGNAEIMKVLKGTVDSLAKDPGGVSLYSSKSTSANKGKFLIAPCAVDSSRQVTVALLGLHFEAPQNEKNFFFFKWKSSSMRLWVSTQKCTLNEDLYQQVRDDIRQKLGDKANTNIHKLELEDI